MLWLVQLSGRIDQADLAVYDDRMSGARGDVALTPHPGDVALRGDWSR
jgi:hypothetical protein